MEYIEIMHLVNGNIHVSAQDKERWNKNGYDEIQKVAPYLYEAWYSNLDYAKADRYFRTKAVPVTPSGCSAVRMGAFYGRNLDWYYNNQAEIMVHTKHEHGRNAVFGICSSMGGLDDAFVTSGMYSELYDYVPFMLVDGINEHGLVVNTNVVPAGEKGNNSYINRGSSSNVDICSLMLVRYLLDKCSSVADAKSFFNEQPKIYQPLTLLKGGFEQHFMVADESSTAIIEFVNGGVQFIEDIKPIMTNFHLSGVTFNADGTVTTPAQITDVFDSHPNGITAHGAGLERYNIAVGDYSKVYVKDEMLNLMEKLYYTNAYSLDCLVSERWNTEFVGFDGLVSYSKGVDYADTYERIATKHLSASRADSNFWQTVHSVVYDIENKTATIRIQEEHETTCVRELDAIDYEALRELIKKEEPAPTPEEVAKKAINTGDATLVEETKDALVQSGSVQELQEFGAALAAKGYEPYKYAGMQTAEGFDSENISSFDYSLMSLEYGTDMFKDSTTITSFSADAPILTNGDNMFSGCYNLTDFGSDLGALTSGNDMFHECALTLGSVEGIAESIKSSNTRSAPVITLGLGCILDDYIEEGSPWRAAVRSIEEKGWTVKEQFTVNIDTLVKEAIASEDKSQCQKIGKFAASTGIAEYKYAGAKTTQEMRAISQHQFDSLGYNIMSLENGCSLYMGSSFFGGTIIAPSLTNGYRMFKEASCLGGFVIDQRFPNLENGNEMYYESYAREVTLTAPKLKTADDMFRHCTMLESVCLVIPSVTNTERMFRDCTRLTRFTGDFSSLQNANTMFHETNIYYVDGESFPSLWKGRFMFSHNYNMHTFRANISKVTDGLYMFWGNSSLVTFEGSLESLEDGGNMFDGCILSINSVKNIADTIKTHTSGTHNITVGMGCTEAEYNAEGSEWNSNIQRIKDKGWTVACQYNKR